MMRLRNVFIVAIGIFLLTAMLAAQDLGEAARKERERQAAIRKPARVFTNADLQGGKTSVPASTAKSSQAPGSSSAVLDLNGHDERYWSERFLAAKKRVSDAEQKQAFLESSIRDYNQNLLTRSDVYDREHLYPAVIQEDTQELEKTKKELADAKKALDDLTAELRQSGAPMTWADSKRAAQSTPPDHPDRAYYLKRLKEIDDQYEETERPYKVERFRLVYRRSPDKKDSLNVDTSRLGQGADPSLPSLDAKIAEIEQKHQQARTDLINQARRNGINIP